MNMNNNMHVSEIEEELFMQEKAVEWLLQRRETIQSHITSLHETKHSQEQRRQELQQKILQLMSSRQQHLQLQQELQQALDKSRDRLTKISGVLEEETEHDNSIEDHDYINHNQYDNQNDIDNQNQHDNHNHNDKELLYENDQPKNLHDDLNTITNEDALSSLHVLTVPVPSMNLKSIKQIHLFWYKTNNHAISTFFPSLLQQQLLQSMMNCMALQALIDAQSRRQFIYDTILWIPKTQDPIPPTNDVNVDDDRIDANLTLCPYELAGTCADLYCPFQHLTRDHLTVTREQLRLPDIKLMEQCDENNNSNKTNTEPPRKRQKLQPIAPQEETNKVPGQTMEEDFIALPTWNDETTITDTSDDDNNDDHQHHDEQSQTTDNKSLEFWWMVDFQMPRLNMGELSILSFLEWLHVVCDIQITSETITSSTPPKNGMIPFMGRMVDAIRFCVHAGRFDLATGIASLVKQYIDDDAHLPLWQLVMDLITSAWKFHANHHGPLVSSFTTNIGMAILSECFRLIRDDDSSIGAISNVMQRLFHTQPSKKLLQRDMQQLAELNHDKQSNLQAILHYAIAYRQGHANMNIAAVKGKFPPCELMNSSKPSGLSHIMTLGFSAMSASLALIHHPSDQTLQQHIEDVSRTLSTTTTNNNNILISPIKALQVCVLVRQRKYRQAQLSLEFHLHESPHSELLWSQFIQLRSCLPWCPDFVVTKNSFELPTPIAEEQLQLATRIQNKNVHCHHFAMVGDVSLLKAAAGKTIHGQSIWSWVHAIVQGGDEQPMPLDLSNLGLGPTPFPSSVLVGGWAISSLNLHHCQLTELPLAFGTYFPQLHTLTLSKNKLSSLPSSLGLLTHLTTLNVAANQLTALFDSCSSNTPQLQHLDASNNDIQSVEPLQRFSKLVSLNLERNSNLNNPSSLISILKNLKELKWSPPAATKVEPKVNKIILATAHLTNANGILSDDQFEDAME